MVHEVYETIVVLLFNIIAYNQLRDNAKENLLTQISLLYAGNPP